MAKNDFSHEKEIEELVSRLANNPVRDPKMAADGRARFLTQAQSMEQAVSEEKEIRQTGRRSQFFERISKFMKPKLKYSALAAAVIMVIVVIFMANNVSTVSAQQILDRANAAQTAVAGKGISHTLFEIFENPLAVEGKEAGTTTYVDNFDDMNTGKFRSLDKAQDGRILSISSFDGEYYYSTYGQTQDNPIKVFRTPITEEGRMKMRLGNVDETTTAIYDQFNNNPRVKVEGKITRPDGRQAYVLVNQNEQVQKTADGQEKKTYTGTTKMVFDAETYKLLETRITVQENGKDILLYAASTRVDEILSDDGKTAWDLSDIQNISIVDEVQPAQKEEIKIETLSPQELAGRAEAYVLKTIPEGFKQEIVAVVNDPDSEHYQFEVNYHGKDDALFGMQFVGKIDEAFAEKNFYNGSYKTVSGLVLYFSPSGSSGMLISPAGNGYLVSFTMPRGEVEKLVEDLIPLK